MNIRAPEMPCSRDANQKPQHIVTSDVTNTLASHARGPTPNLGSQQKNSDNRPVISNAAKIGIAKRTFMALYDNPPAISAGNSSGCCRMPK